MEGIRGAILTAFETLPPGEALSPAELIARLQEQRPDLRVEEKESAVRGRLTTLKQEGLLERQKHGQYALARTDAETTPALDRILPLVQRHFRPEALRRCVLWDATPYLSLTEDGAPGTRLVVEHPAAGRLWDELYAQNRAGGFHVVRERTTKLLGDLLWSLDEDRPWVEEGVLLLERERLGATGLTPQGYRAPFQERILVEFLSLTTDPTVGAPVVEWILRQPGTTFRRLWQAAHALAAVHDVATLLAALHDRLPDPLRKGFEEETLPVVRSLAWGEAAVFDAADHETLIGPSAHRVAKTSTSMRPSGKAPSSDHVGMRKPHVPASAGMRSSKSRSGPPASVLVQFVVCPFGDISSTAASPVSTRHAIATVKSPSSPSAKNVSSKTGKPPSGE